MTKKIRLLTCFLAILFIGCMSMTVVKTFASETTSATVSFYINEDDSAPYETQIVDYGKYVSIPDTPTKDGHVFICWKNANTTEKYKFSQPVENGVSSLILVAEWEQVVFDVTFKVGAKIVSEQKVEKGSSAIAPLSISSEELGEGKVLTGWDKNYTNVTQNLIVNAVLDVEQYSIPVIGFNGDVIKYVPISYNSTLSISDIISVDEVPEHYTCNSFEWITDVVSAPLNSHVVTGNGTIRLLFTPVNYTATFKVEGVADVEQIVPAYSLVPYPAMPSKENQIFIGWYVYGTNNLFEFQTELVGDVILEAKFISAEKTKYDVVFYDGLGNQYGGIQRVEEGGNAIEPGSPYMEGYDFISWDKDFTNVTENISVYPIFSVKTYAVTFLGDEGEELAVINNVRYGESVPENLVPAYKDVIGKEFICWDNSYKNIKQDTVITATYKQKIFSVMFFDDNMNKIGLTQNVKYGESAIVPPVSKVGYNFLGWKGGNPTYITDISVFFAEFEVIQFNVTFVYNDEITENAVVKVDYGKTAYSLEPSNRGESFSFKGWFTDDGTFANAFNFNNPITKNLTLYACWEEEPPTVTYKIDGAIYLEQPVIVGGNATAPIVPARYGYTFVCWKIEGTETVFDFEQPIIEAIVLVAEFTQNTYKVTFYFGDNQSVVLDVLHGEKVLSSQIPSELSKIGYDFDGWNIDITQRQIFGDISITANYKIKNYSVKYFVDGNQIKESSVPYNGYAQMISAPSKVGYTFRYWKAENTTQPFDFGNLRVTDDLNLVAEYTINSYNVNYYLNGTLIKTERLEHGSTIDLDTPPEFNETIQEFKGWTANTAVVNGSDVVVTGEIYTFQEFKVSYYINGELYNEVLVFERSNFSLIDAPTNEEINPNISSYVITFNGWNCPDGYNEMPEIMPAKNIVINANITTRYYYNLYYYVNGAQVKDFKVLEGSVIEQFDFDGVGLEENIKFLGWKDVPSVMPNSDYVIEASFEVLQVYNVFYYVNGNLVKTVPVLETKLIPESTTPENLAENETFINWSLPVDFDIMPEFMPSQDLIIHANLNIKSYYVLSYYINGTFYTSVTLLEGSEVPAMADPIIENQLIVFVDWANEPTIMPSQDTIVEANVRELQYYYIRYYINGELFYPVRVLEGMPIPVAPAVEQGNLPENVQFDGWKLPEGYYEMPKVMPQGDLIINANVVVKAYHTITYMIGNEVYDVVTYMEGSQVSKMPAPNGLDKTIIFNGWIDEPEFMGDKDIYIYADITELGFYSITYYIAGVEFMSVTVLEGNPIPNNPTPTDIPEGYEFVGWETIDYTVMPAQNLTVNAILNELEKLPNNVIVTNINNADGSLTVKIEVKGEVNFAGVQGEIVVDNVCNGLDSFTNDGAGYAYMQDGSNIVNFVWSKGDNVTENTLLMELTLTAKDGGYVMIQGFTVYNVKAFDENGNVVDVEHNIEIKIK